MVICIKKPALSFYIGMIPSDTDISDDERGTANPDTEWKKVYYYCTDHLGRTQYKAEHYRLNCGL